MRSRALHITVAAVSSPSEATCQGICPCSHALILRHTPRKRDVMVIVPFFSRSRFAPQNTLSPLAFYLFQLLTFFYPPPRCGNPFRHTELSGPCRGILCLDVVSLVFFRCLLTSLSESPFGDQGRRADCHCLSR